MNVERPRKVPRAPASAPRDGADAGSPGAEQTFTRTLGGSQEPLLAPATLGGAPASQNSSSLPPSWGPDPPRAPMAARASGSLGPNCRLYASACRALHLAGVQDAVPATPWGRSRYRAQQVGASPAGGHLFTSSRP